ncbi:MAG: 3D domain-containing protein [Phycisphaerales bacterium]|nr:3D domain-containing protein [Phycisphaerales bacterium]
MAKANTKPNWETPAFVGALVLTAASAVAAKRSWTTPPLAQMGPAVARSAQAEEPQLPTNPLGIVDPLVLAEQEAAARARRPAPPSTPDAAVGRYTPPAGFERYYAGRPLRRARTLSMRVTAYSPDERSCGDFADGVTASNSTVWRNGMQLVAADTAVLPFGTLVSIDGYANGEVVPVLDRGGKIKGMRLDVLFPTHEQAMQWGVHKMDVVVWEYADE